MYTIHPKAVRITTPLAFKKQLNRLHPYNPESEMKLALIGCVQLFRIKIDISHGLYLHRWFGEAFEAEAECGSAPDFGVQELDSSAGEAGHNAFG